MKLIPTRIPDVVIVEPAVFGDDRGWFMESYHHGKFVAALAELARRAGLQRAPALYRVPSRLPNAFALGRPEDSAICVTHRLLDQLYGENSPGFWRMRSGISPTATCGS